MKRKKKIRLNPGATVQLNRHDMASHNEVILVIGVRMDGIHVPSGLSKIRSVVPTREVRSESGMWGKTQTYTYTQCPSVWHGTRHNNPTSSPDLPRGPLEQRGLGKFRIQKLCMNECGVQMVRRSGSESLNEVKKERSNKGCNSGATACL